MREVLDGLAARLCAERAGKAELARVEKPLAAMRRCLARGDANQWFPAHVEFHDAIFAASGNARLTALGTIIFFLHHEQRLAFRLSSLSWSQLAIPLLYAGLALIILVAYLAGFMLVAFHPRRLALHDILAGTQVCFKSPPPAAVQVIDAVKATSLGRKHR